MNAASGLDARLGGTRATAIRDEYLGNSAHFPLANILLEMLREGPAEFFRSPDPYALLAVGLVQAAFLGSWRFARRPRPFVGNLIGPSLYTAVEAAIEGPRFFLAPHHVAYWFFAVAIGALQELRLRTGTERLAAAALVAENVVRAAIIVVMYAIFEAFDRPEYTTVAGFYSDSSHTYVTLAVLALGGLLGAAQLTAEVRLGMLRETAGRLRRYSELAMGRAIVERAVQDEASLSLTRRDRAIVVIDVRGFTAWSERQTPEEVVRMLNALYAQTERTATAFGPIRIKFTADEAMLVFAEPRAAVDAALALRERLADQLAPFGLGAGAAVHVGPVVEGLLGSESIMSYDVVGDAVNVAHRLCGEAGRGEILVSMSVPDGHPALAAATLRELMVRGKSEPLRVRALSSPGAP